MIQYEIHISGENNPFYDFTSHYQFKTDEKIFIRKDNKIYSITVVGVAHDITPKEHIVRLNCTFNKLFSE